MYSKLTPIRPQVLYPKGQSFDDPKGWTDVCTSGTGPVSVEITMDYDTGESTVSYFAVYLTASTEYTFYGTGTYSNARIDVYDSAGTKVAYNQGDMTEPDWEWVVSDCVYTPSESGVYVFAVFDGSEMGDSADTYSVYVTPRPSEHSMAGPTPYETSAGVENLSVARSRRAIDVGITDLDYFALKARLGLEGEAWLRWIRLHWWRWYSWLDRMCVLAPLEEYEEFDELNRRIEYDSDPQYWGTYTLPSGVPVLHFLAGGAYNTGAVFLRSLYWLNQCRFMLTFKFWFMFDPLWRKEGAWAAPNVQIMNGVLGYYGSEGTTSSKNPPPHLGIMGDTIYNVTLAPKTLHYVTIDNYINQLTVRVNGTAVYTTAWTNDMYFIVQNMTFLYNTVVDGAVEEPLQGHGVTNVSLRITSYIW